MKMRVLAALAITCSLAGGCAFVAPFPDLAPDPAGEDQQPPAGEGAHVASAGFGGAGEQRGTAVVATASGTVIAASASGALDLGGGELTELGNASSPDCAIASFSSDGEHRFSRRFGDCVARGLAVGVDGDLILAGSSDGDVDFGGGVLPRTSANEDMVLARFDAYGVHRWSRRFGNGASQIATAVAVDAAGNSYVTGTFWGKLDFDPKKSEQNINSLGADDQEAEDEEDLVLNSAGESDGFLVKIDAEGQAVWARRFGDGAHHQAGTAVAVDGQGNVILAGWFKGTLGLGTAGEESVGESDAFVAKLSSSGDLLWKRVAPSGSAARALGVAADSAGNVAVVGSFRGDLTVGSAHLTNAGDKDIVVVKLDENGSPLWVKSFGDAADQEALAVSTDPAGNVLVTGAFLGRVELGASPLEASGAPDGFLAKLASGGDVLWARSFGDVGEQGGAAIDTDPLGNTWATGYFSGVVDFGGGSIQSGGASDVFLVELGP